MQIAIEKIIEDIISAGATKVSVIDASEVSTDKVFRDICKANSCGSYGRCWACPPHCGEIDELMESLKAYDKAVVFQSVGELEDSYDFEGMTEHKEKFVEVIEGAREAFNRAGVDGALVLGAGGCGICPVCSCREGKPCRFPSRAIVSLEAYGINVSLLAKTAGMKYINGANTVTYFGAVFYGKKGE